MAPLGTCSPQKESSSRQQRILPSKASNVGRAARRRLGRLGCFGVRVALPRDAATQRARLHALRRPRDDFCDLWQHADQGAHQGVEASASRRLRGQLLAPLAGIQPAEVRSPLRRMRHAPTRVLCTRRTPRESRAKWRSMLTRRCPLPQVRARSHPARGRQYRLRRLVWRQAVHHPVPLQPRRTSACASALASRPAAVQHTKGTHRLAHECICEQQGRSLVGRRARVEGGQGDVVKAHCQW